MLRQRDWKLYTDIKSRLLRKASSLGVIDRSFYSRGVEIVVTGTTSLLKADIGKMILSENIKDVVLTFQYDTLSKNLQHLHLMQVNDVNNERSILILRKKWVLNREVPVLSQMTHEFVQGLFKYSLHQELLDSLAVRYGVPPRLLPIGFGFSVKDWEEKFNVPSAGTEDVLGSYMHHVHTGRLKLDGRPIHEP